MIRNSIQGIIEIVTLTFNIILKVPNIALVNQKKYQKNQIKVTIGMKAFLPLIWFIFSICNFYLLWNYLIKYWIFSIISKKIRKGKQDHSLSYKTGTVLQIKFPFPMLICSEILMKPYKCLFVLASSSVKAHSGMLILQKCLVFLKKIWTRTYIITNLKTFFYITFP